MHVTVKRILHIMYMSVFHLLIVTVLSVIHCVQLLNRHKTKNMVRQKFYTCTNMKANTHTDTYTTTLCLNTYFHSHYAD